MGRKETLRDSGAWIDLSGALDMHQGGTHELFNMKNICLGMNWDESKAPGTAAQSERLHPDERNMEAFCWLR